MKKEYNIVKKLVSYILVVAVLFIVVPIFIPNFKFNAYSIILLMLIIFIVMVVTLKDYKIIIEDECISFYRLFSKPKIFKTTDIRKISIANIRVPNRIRGAVRDILIITNDEQFIFNIHELENEDLYRDIKLISQKNNIIFTSDKVVE
jgi:hypothetical protein